MNIYDTLNGFLFVGECKYVCMYVCMYYECTMYVCITSVINGTSKSAPIILRLPAQ